MVIQILVAIAVGAEGGALRAGDDHLSLLQTQASVKKTTSDAEKEEEAIKTWAETSLFTMHGGECASDWHYKGLALHGCVYTDGHDMPWCFLKKGDKKGYNKTSLINVTETSFVGVCTNASTCHEQTEEREGMWDFCALPEEVSTHYTVEGCHCLPTWEHNRQVYSGCSQPDPEKTPFCYVAETECKGAQAPADDKKQKWDDCDLQKHSPAFVTRHSCHCKPRWSHNGKKQTSCAPQKLLEPPPALLAMNMSLETENASLSGIYGWCHVFEDERSCTGAVKVKGTNMDVCFLVDDTSISTLQTTVHGCHCLPEWGLDGIMHQGCTKTGGVGEEQAWCRVVEDEAVCVDSLGPEDATQSGAGRGAGRWDWCEPAGHDKGEWRHSDERFTPKEPDPPTWYLQFRGQTESGKTSDLWD